MSKKQFVFIMTDTQRWDMVHCYADRGLSTPCLDKLAEEGIRYEKAYTTQPVCGPARCGIFTGNYPSSACGWGNGMTLSGDIKTIGQRLTDNGIHCAYIGKWHLDGTDYFGSGICPEGWDDEYWYDMRRYLEEMTEDDRIKSRMSQTMDFEDVPESFTYGQKVLNRAKDFMEKYKNEDYLLCVSFDEPHFPFLCPQPYADMYKDYEFPKSPAVWDTLEGKPDYQKVWAAERLKPDRDAVRIRNPYYFACNSYVDSLIGQVADAAPESAMIMYTSDHGDLLESHCLFAKGPAAYEDNARIPFIVRNPQGAKGVYSKHPVSHIDCAPTILEYFGIPVPKFLDGESILDTTYDLDADAPEYAFIEFGRFEVDHDHYGGYQPMRAVTDGRYKLSVNLMSSDEFYDLEKDPYELTNLIDDPAYEADRNRLHDAILDRMCRQRDPFRGYYWECRPWRKDLPAPNWRYRGFTRQAENEEYAPRQLDFVNGLEMNHAQRFKVSGGNMSFSSLNEMIEYLRHYDDDNIK